MTHVPVRSFLTLPMLLFSAMAFGDGDEPPVYVAVAGIDDGDCRQMARPCQSISYALRHVGKNAELRVGAGSFELTDSADIIYLLSGAIEVRGNYDTSSRSTLVGVPPEFASELEAKGFHVIIDSKGLHSDAVKTQLSVQSNMASTVCTGGFANVYPCRNVDLLSHIADRTPGARGADIWGFMDLNTHREYAIIGYSSGTAVFDVTDAENPKEVGFINGQSTTWRDIKVYQFWNATDDRWNAFAYVTADNASDGLVIIDLSQLPHRISRINYPSDFSAAHNVFLTDIDYSTGLALSGSHAPNLILAGSNIGDGRFRAYSLANPAAPSFIAAPATPGDQPGGNRLYMHDAASMQITDARKDSQCVNAGNRDHCDVLFDFNESSVDTWDISVPSSPVRLSQMPYSNASYTHSGWQTEDQQYLFIQDELDERNRNLPTTLRVLSVADLTAPALVGTWTGPTTAIDHNGFVRGNRYYMSNYSRGLTILDISNPASPQEVGGFDTYPASDANGFPGNWGVYPFLPSGNIALSDIDSGFYMVVDNTGNVPQGQFSFSAASFGADETQTLRVTVQRTGGAQGAANVAWRGLAADGTLDDITSNGGVLSWADGDASDRTINIGLTNDGVTEGIERILIRLIAPTGGATLATPALTSAYISDPGDIGVVEFSSAALDIPERSFGTAVAVVHRSGSAVGPVSVDYSVTAGDASAGADYSGSAAGTLNWADGDANPKWIEYAITDDGTGESSEFFDIELSNVVGGNIGANNIMRVTIIDGTGSNSAPNAVAGGSQIVNIGTTVMLNGSSSNDPDGDALSYSWSQITGPAVSLNNASSVTASFTAPSVSSDTLLRFELQVTDTSGLFDTATINVTVTATAISGGGGSGGGALGLLMLAGL
ncbi:MAG TPA: choice-of-anchor B family protein, partial [Woeseiaceae bacterium]|nr:choice-of-anchor B family protein [Woeseiaceae bacterium]